MLRRGAGPIRSKRGGGRPVPRAPKKPQTAEDLDKELDMFMGDGSKETESSVATEATPSAVEGDVEMA